MNKILLPPPRKLPKPYYQDEWVTIYHGDSRCIAPLLGKFDLGLHDPPYGIGESKGRNKSRSKIATAKDYGNDSWDNSPPTKLELHQLIFCAKKTILFGGNYFEVGPTPCWLVWDKDNSGDFADAELAWTNLDCAVRLFKFRWNGMIQQNMKEKEFREHPTQKPEPVIRWCIEKAIKAIGKVETILDAYAGSCTTGRAAKNMKIKCVCIEREEKYCEVGARRMAQEVLL